MITLGVDGYPVSGPRTGVGRYTAELLKSLATQECVQMRIRVALAPHHPGWPPAVGDLEASGISLARPWKLRSNAYRLLDRLGLGLPFDNYVGGADVALFPNYRWFPTRHAPTVTVIYDMLSHLYPEFIDPRYAGRHRNTVERAIRRSDRLITISQAVREEILDFFPVVEERLWVIRPGSSRPSPSPQALLRPLVPPLRDRQFLLHVGTLEPRKGVDVLIRAFARLPRTLRSSFPLVFAGAVGWLSPTAMTELRQARDVHILGSVDDATLGSLYRRATATVSASRYEGFGLPVLESLAHGTPVVCTDLPSHREVAGAAAVYARVDDPDSLAAALEDLLVGSGSPSRPDPAVAVSTFSWRRSAESLALHLQQLIGG